MCCQALYPAVLHSGTSRQLLFLVYAVSFYSHQLYLSSKTWKCFISVFVNWINILFEAPDSLDWGSICDIGICACLLVYLTNEY